MCMCVQNFIGRGCSAGVQMIRVGLLAEKAEVKYNPSVLTPEDLVSSIKSLGFGASLVDTVNTTEGKIELMVITNINYTLCYHSNSQSISHCKNY